ncbi:unnamed protein product, partial [Anisakis simplex]|uniref:7TM_GPCR_Srx domain-containing protein n=1 Tax=Anisakis simplex TaxID=6269 RepID=A0A0M3J9E2_ANISI
MIADFTVLFTFAAYAAPRTFFNDMEVLKNTTLNRFMGQLNITAYVACIYTHLLRSTCRFMAISLPIRHSRIFTQRNTIAALFLGCAFTYVVDQYGFMYSDTTCGMAIKLVIDFAQYLIVILFVAILDAITIFRIHQYGYELIFQAVLQDSAFLIFLIFYML